MTHLSPYLTQFIQGPPSFKVYNLSFKWKKHAQTIDDKAKKNSIGLGFPICYFKILPSLGQLLFTFGIPIQSFFSLNKTLYTCPCLSVTLSVCLSVSTFDF